MIFLILWLLSPIALGILCIYQRVRINDLESKLKAVSDVKSPDRSADLSDNLKPSRNRDSSALPSYYFPVQNGKAEYTGDTAKRHEHMNSKNEELKSGPPVNVILILGALFIILAGFVFAAAAWGTLNAVFKSAVLLSFSAVFFAVYYIARYKLKLESTGRIFYILGSVFLPASAAAGGKLRVFGDFLSFDGRGRFVLCMIMFILLSVCFFIGAKSYKNKIYARIAFLSLAASMAFLMLHGSVYTPAFSSAAVGLCAVAAVIAEPGLKKRFTDSVIIGEYRFFTVVVTLVPAVVSLFISHGGAEQIVPAAMFSAAFLAGALKSERPEIGAAAFAVYLMTGMLSGIRPNSAESFILTASAVMVIYTLLIFIDFVPESVKNTVRIIQKAVCVPIIAAGFAVMLDSGFDFHPSQLISSAAVAVQVILLACRNGGSGKLFGVFAVIWFSAETGSFIGYLAGNNDAAALCSAVVIFVYFALITLTPAKEKLGSVYTGAVSCIVLSLLVFMCCEPVPSAAVWLLAAGAAFISAVKSNFGRVFLPIAVFAVIRPIYVCGAGFSLTYSYCIASVIFCAAACLLTAVPRLRKLSAPMEIGVSVIFLLYIIPMLHAPHISVPLALTLFTGVNAFVKRKSPYIHVLSGGFFTALYLAVFEAGRCAGLEERAFLLPAAVMILLFGVYMLPKGGASSLKACISSFLRFFMPVYGIAVLIVSGAFDNAENIGIGGMFETPLFLVCGAALIICSCIYAVKEKRTFLITAAMIAFYIKSFAYFSGIIGINEAAVFIIGLMALTNLFGRLVFYGNTIVKSADNIYFDFLSLSSLVGSALLFFSVSFGDAFDTGKYIRWSSFATASLVLLNMSRYGNDPKLNRCLLTASAAFVMPVLWFQPFLPPMELLEDEWNAAAIALFAVLFGKIHKGNPQLSGRVNFAAGIICLIYLFTAAYTGRYAEDAIMLGGAILLMLIFSHIRKNKKWFGLSVAGGAGEALMLTLKLWNSRTWWVYLLAAGIGLIVLGVSRENSRRKTAVSLQEDKEK
ncbi:MAG: hypothetical protein NC120_11205 [Ruminococcus sp.]|nr:hypothetical protein [Ruminococcus sp.]